MALRDQPYLPLYVQDYLTDEDLNLCSWSTQGIYIKILCILHKQKEYGTILFKQTDKQTFCTCLDFASILIKHIPCPINEMEHAIKELVDNEVMIIDGNKLYQKRMVRDGKKSEARSLAGKKGGGNPALFKQKDKQQFKQKDKQNTEYENEYINENINKDIVKNNKSLKNKKAKFDFKNSLIELGGDVNLVDGWMAVRKLKKGANTETALKLFMEEVGQSGHTLNDVLKFCVKNNWLGFKAEWVSAKVMPSSGFTIDDLFGNANK